MFVISRSSCLNGIHDRRSLEALREVSLYFLRLGFTAFGGPAAHIAMMEEEVVRRRRWMSRADFLDLIGATNLIPGPNSTEMAIHVGYRRAGWPGLIAAGVCFIVPAAAVTLVFAWAYQRYGAFPQAKDALYGIKPVIIAVVGQALWGLTRSAVKNRLLAALTFAAATASTFGVNELLVLLGGGLLVVAAGSSLARTSGVRLGGVEPFGLAVLFLFFMKVGSVLYGSGYVLLAFLQATLVERWGWLTQTQLLDAVAAGQMTPGPVFTTATFVGYLVGGLSGAAAATVGIFLPSFVFVALSGPVIPRLRRSPAAGAFLDGVNASSLALMAVVTLSLARSAIVDTTTALLAATAAWLLIFRRVNSAWLVIGGGVLGYALPRLFP
ncbi:MAG: chromate transporter [Elusimicrobia bacterium]|nr:chromate transporter [Elusimicrobiota bacterium]